MHRIVPMLFLLMLPLVSAAGQWTVLEKGLELGVFQSPQKSPLGDSRIRVLRIDPAHFRFHLLNASAEKEKKSRTARDWARRYRMVAAINASMYQRDHLTSVSFMRRKGHINNRRVSRDNTLLVFQRKSGTPVPEVSMVDRECDSLEQAREHYHALVQSIRMISCKGKNVWSQQKKRWSTALIARDIVGRILFIHVRSPYSTHDLINILQKLPLQIKTAMYVEGGPEAQLYINSRQREYLFIGSFETGFNENDGISIPWPVPNVIAISRR